MVWVPANFQWKTTPTYRVLPVGKQWETLLRLGDAIVRVVHLLDLEEWVPANFHQVVVQRLGEPVFAKENHQCGLGEVLEGRKLAVLRHIVGVWSSLMKLALK